MQLSTLPEQGQIYNESDLWHVNLFSNPYLLLFCKVKALDFKVCSCGAQLFQYPSYMMQDDLVNCSAMWRWFISYPFHKAATTSKFSLKKI